MILRKANEWLTHTPLALALIIIACTVGAIAVIGAVQIGNNTRSIDAFQESECFAASFRVAQGDLVAALVSNDPAKIQRALPAYSIAFRAEADHVKGGDLPCPLAETEP